MTRINYIYHFGDSWEHTHVVSDVRAGERDCPTEDCGRIPGFYETLEAKTDPDYPEHAEI